MKDDNKDFGEFICPECKKVFHIKRSFNAHLGIHVREAKGPPKCKKCKTTLTDKNWYKSQQKTSCRICKKCLKVENRKNYLKKKQKKMRG